MSFKAKIDQFMRDLEVDLSPKPVSQKDVESEPLEIKTTVTPEKK